MPGNAAPIGVFDSGVGGLSVLREIRLLLPREDLLYVADSHYCPYGGRSAEVIRGRARAITEFLVQRGAKAIVVACNTATVAALDLLRGTLMVPIVGMEPAVKPAVAVTRTGVVGVLATGVTLSGERFTRLVERFGSGADVVTQACPGLVERVEAGDTNSPRTRALLQRYLDPLLERGADTLVLGCTHYLFLRAALAELLPREVRVIDAGAAVARQTQRVLAERGHLVTTQGPGQERFYSSGEVALVGPVVERLWGAPVVVAHIAV